MPSRSNFNGHPDLSEIDAAPALAAAGIRQSRLINNLWCTVKRATITGSTRAAFASFSNSGPPEKWAINWANNSLAEARKDYAPLKINRELADGTYELGWPGKAAYDAQCQPIVAKQLAAASQNLAALLNAIFV